MDICTYCGSSKNIEEDHVLAKSKGGVTTIPACKNCNRSKGDKPLMEWLRWVKENDSYRWNQIIKHNFNKKNDIAQKIQKIRDEN